MYIVDGWRARNAVGVKYLKSLLPVPVHALLASYTLIQRHFRGFPDLGHAPRLHPQDFGCVQSKGPA